MLRATTLTVVVLLALAPAWARAAGGEKSLNITAELTKDDPADAVKKLSKCKVYPFPMKKDSTWEINLKSKDFDAFLRVEDSAGKELAYDDDSGGL